MSRRHIVESTKTSLKRLDQEYVDVIYCHHPDPYTPIEETVRAMNFVINQGWVSTGAPASGRLPRSTLDRNKVEFEYVDLYKKYKLGLSTWSPLVYGTRTGKCSAGTHEGPRMENPQFEAIAPDFVERVVKADKLGPVADMLGLSMSELALAWCVSNEDVSTVMIGAKTLAQR
ncbi:voltage-gated potassium channel subunit beta [Phytophthora cinnamomi]|uniref:voltage-gated potassium channel subunit beta n=1 Tax=Phytophthora cinnamomi TaxID=4785 RepID=UPI00355A198B|nr:voltage-gated potassium channel subunit beta [Phytophthora cinnamomi]